MHNIYSFGFCASCLGVCLTFLTSLEGKQMINNLDYMKTGSIEPAVLQDIYTLNYIYSYPARYVLSILDVCVSTLDSTMNTVFTIGASPAVV